MCDFGRWIEIDSSYSDKIWIKLVCLNEFFDFEVLVEKIKAFKKIMIIHKLYFFLLGF